MTSPTDIHRNRSRTSQVPPKNQTLGWQPTCDHDAATVPATVLDPFVGSRHHRSRRPGRWVGAVWVLISTPNTSRYRRQTYRHRVPAFGGTKE